MYLSKYQTEQLRIASALIDRMLFLPLVLVEKRLYTDHTDHNLFVSWLILTAVLRVMYAAFLHYRFGYTFGKWLVGIRVVDLTETRNLNFREGLIRESFYFMIEIAVISIFYSTLMHHQDHGMVYAKYRNLARNVGLLWIFVTLSIMFSNPKRRTIPDFLGNSVVVRL